MANKQYERVGGGSYEVYRARKKADFWAKVGEIIGGLCLAGIALLVLSVIFG